MISLKRALLSVSDKSGLVPFAQSLQSKGISLIASGGTYRTLKEAGLAVSEIAELTQAPEMLGGRVKTLHPVIHGGILARRDVDSDQTELAQRGIDTIDMVVVNLYPFELTIAQSETTFSDAIEQIDIGGPTLLRAAAKNCAHVVTVCDPADYDDVLATITEDGQFTAEQAKHLARKTFARITAYDAAISNYFEQQCLEEGESSLPSTWSTQFTKTASLRYGENPHQAGAWYQVPGQATTLGEPLQGKSLSYNNIFDTDAAVNLVRDFASEPFAVSIIKHGNPCGMGVSQSSLHEAFERAKSGDPVSAFGGIVACSQELDADTASAIAETFFEVIAAPSFAPAAREILAEKKNLRLLPCDLSIPPACKIRSAGGGVLIQDADIGQANPSTWEIPTQRKPSDEECQAMLFAWRMIKHVQSNAIVFTTGTHAVGVGAGQMSRIDSTELAAKKARDKPVFAAASDAFFPFRDGIDALAQAGIKAIIQPGGSIRDGEVVQAANEHDIAMIMTGMRHFKH